MDSIKKCPFCGSEGSVIDSRTDRGGRVRRRRLCPNCKIRWNTWEISEDKLEALEDIRNDLMQVADKVKKLAEEWK